MPADIPQPVRNIQLKLFENTVLLKVAGWDLNALADAIPGVDMVMILSHNELMTF